eukprot:gene32006-39538_t
MVGGNSVVYLDEPTAGLDPVSRRQLWELVEKNRAGRAILLTTHFMDEADVLGDRIAIVKEGRLRALGTSKFLKKRFGLGYLLKMSLVEGANVKLIVNRVTEVVLPLPVGPVRMTSSPFLKPFVSLHNCGMLSTWAPSRWSRRNAGEDLRLETLENETTISKEIFNASRVWLKSERSFERTHQFPPDLHRCLPLAALSPSERPSAASETWLLHHLQFRVTKGSAPAKVAVKDVSISIQKGEVFGLLGANGAGKTTLLKMVSGQELPSSGFALINGFDVVRNTSEAQRSMGLCPQFDTLVERLTVKENLLFFGQIKGLSGDTLIIVCDAFMVAMNIKKYQNKAIMQLSGGNRRKVSLAVALLVAPPTVYLDEPSTGLDPVVSRLMWRLLSKISSVKQ